jgi:hypothetical protein
MSAAGRVCVAFRSSTFTTWSVNIRVSSRPRWLDEGIPTESRTSLAPGLSPESGALALVHVYTCLNVFGLT